MLTKDEKVKCHAIIHSFAIACGTSNAVRVPKLGTAIDTLTITFMCLSLARVFGIEMDQTTAAMTAASIIKQKIAGPTKAAANALSKMKSWLGPLFSSSVSIAYVEIVGWAIAYEMKKQASGAGGMIALPKLA
ncbi:MAG: hypothetical protein GX945_00500 [Lentisphaerae bacterium]|nr:hypothetical protein [Lentisphaerota bacterium]